MYKRKHPESTLIEIINQQNENIIEGCIYMCLCIGLNKFNNDHLVYSSSLVPQITTPFCLSPRSKTFIDNIFTTYSTKDTISGNILTKISCHLAQFILFPIAQLKCDKKWASIKEVITISNQMFFREIEKILLEIGP